MRPGASGAEPTAAPALSVLVSHALVAFTIEVDNEFEHRMAHRTTRHRTEEVRPGPWLGSMVLWSNCLRLLGPDGLTVSELRARARTGTNLPGLRRWGYVTFDPEPLRSKTPAADALVVPTRAGMRAKGVWEEVVPEVERRWAARFGVPAVEAIGAALRCVVDRADVDLPDGLPILGPGLWSMKRPGGDQLPTPRRGAAADDDDSSELPLAALLARVLLLFALDFERQSTISLAIAVDVLRVLERSWGRLADVPRRGGVSKEAVAMAMGVLTKRGLAVLGQDPTRRGRVVHLTEKGARLGARSHRLVAAVEQQWKDRYGSPAVAALRRALTPVVVGTPGGRAPLWSGLDPYPDGWRARLPAPDVLPDFPMVLHRGGYPDGS